MHAAAAQISHENDQNEMQLYSKNRYECIRNRLSTYPLLSHKQGLAINLPWPALNTHAMNFLTPLLLILISVTFWPITKYIINTILQSLGMRKGDWLIKHLNSLNGVQ